VGPLEVATRVAVAFLVTAFGALVHKLDQLYQEVIRLKTEMEVLRKRLKL